MKNSMQDIAFVIEEGMQGTRLDVVLSLVLEEMSRSYLQKLIEEERVQVNGKVCTIKKMKLVQGDEISLSIPEPETLDLMPEDIPLSIVYEDDDLLVVNKPKGMVVHPGAGNTQGTLVNALLFHCTHLSSINGVIRPGIVHRIDKDTSGLLMVAKNDFTHRSLAEQLERHSIARAYHAIVYHNLQEEEGTVDAPIGRDTKDRLKMAVVRDGGRRAVTHYRVMQRFGNFTYLEARLETGRTHQIRVHMAHIHHPLLGDSVYGPKKQLLGAKSQMLHAKILGFVHPRTNEYLEFEAELPPEFQETLKKLEARKYANG